VERQEFVWDREYRDRGTVWNPRILRLPLVFEGKFVLEVGAGNGKTLEAILGQKPRKVVALDFSAEALKKCREKFAGLKNVSFVKADASKMPFSDCEFDAVVLFYVLDNMLQQGRLSVVKEVFRVLKPQGVVLFEDFAVGDFRELEGKRTAIPEPHTLLKKKGLLCHYFDVDEVKSLFSGFSSVEVSMQERKPIRNKEFIVRRKITGMMVK
jgi:ubiquinone/menaquinone biosynthesis C-methylase UbiE